MKFLVDMPLSPLLAVWLRENGHDADHVSSVSLHKAKDHHIIEAARRQNRIIITADLDFPQLLAISRAADPGVILSGRELQRRTDASTAQASSRKLPRE